MSVNGYNEFSIETLHQGEVLRKLNYELEGAVKNCRDLNTTQKKRTVTLKITLEPNDQRNEIMTEYETSSKLAGEAPGADTIIISPAGQSYVSDKDQLTFGDQIIQIDGEEAAND